MPRSISESFKKLRERFTSGDASFRALGAPGTASSTAPAAPKLLLMCIAVALLMNLVLGAVMLLRGAPEPAEESAEVGRIAGPHEREARLTVHQAERALAGFDVEMERWRGEVEPLLANEDGRRIAADAKALESFVALFDHTSPEIQTAERLRQDLEAAKAQLEAALGGEGAEQALLTLLAELRELRNNAEVVSAAAEQSRKAVLSLISAEATPADNDLKTAADALRRRQAEELAEATQREKAIQHRQQLIFEQDAARKQAVIERMRKEAANDRVRYVLAPFITPTRKIAGKAYDESKLHSLKFLYGAQALFPDRKGYERLVWCAVSTDLHPNPWKALAAGGKISAQQWTKEQVEFVQEAQAYLTKYGQTLVELGLLSP